MSEIQWTKIKHDVNGNPRYVCHYTNLLTSDERGKPNEFVYSLGITVNYLIAIRRANKLGGRKYHTKRFGGGLVFQSYSLNELENSIRTLIDTESNHEQNEN